MEQTDDEHDWPEHWMSRDAAASARLVPVGSQTYHQVTTREEDEHSRRILDEHGYRLCLLRGDPQYPTKNRHCVYRKMAPMAEEHDTDE